MPNQVEVSGTLDGKPIILVWQLEPGKVRSVDTTLDGKKTVSGGRQVPGGAEVPAQNKCG
jgi:hypothetical protein